jgi:hypothetical protein
MQREDEAFQDQEDHGEVEPPGHGPDYNDHLNVPQNFQFQGAVVPPLIHVVNLRELDPPIFRGLLHEDVMAWTYQFQRVSEFNNWGP